MNNTASVKLTQCKPLKKALGGLGNAPALRFRRRCAVIALVTACAAVRCIVLWGLDFRRARRTACHDVIDLIGVHGFPFKQCLDHRLHFVTVFFNSARARAYCASRIRRISASTFCCVVSETVEAILPKRVSCSVLTYTIVPRESDIP